MLKSTVGTWVNYGTTAIFYVLFAKTFGATGEASAYVTTFAIAVALSAIFTSTAQTIYVPRLISRDGDVVSAGLRRMSGLALLALAVFAGFALIAPAIAPVIAPTLAHAGVHLVALMRYAAVFGFLQVLVGQLTALSWARGARFVPAVTPAIPSIIAAIALVPAGHVATPTLYALLTGGSLLQVLLLTGTCARGLELSSEPLAGLRGLTSAWLGCYAVQQFIVPFEVLMAARASSSGGADFNYAYRGLTVAQLLIIGGVAYAALPDWSNYARLDARVALERAIARAISLAALALSLAAAVGLVASKTLVRLVFQHGSFTAHDTDIVSTILVVGLVGFVAEGVMLVLSPALVADGRDRASIAVGLARTALVLVLVSILGLTNGPVGVAVGYSTASLLALAGLLVYVVRVGMLTKQYFHLARSSALVAVLTGAAAGALLGVNAPPVAGAVLVVAVFAIATVSLRHGLPKLRLPA